MRREWKKNMLSCLFLFHFSYFPWLIDNEEKQKDDLDNIHILRGIIVSIREIGICCKAYINTDEALMREKKSVKVLVD